MANTKLPARLLDTSAIPALNVTGDLTVDTTTLKVDSTNNRVGIGTAAATSPFEIAGEGGYNLHFSRGNSTPGGTDPWLGLFNNTNIANATYGWGLYDSGTDGSLQLWNKNNSTTGYDVITFARGGNVGIGTSSPTADLSVGSTATSSGDIHLRTTKTAAAITPSNTAAGGLDIAVGWVNDGQGPLTFTIGSTEAMRIDSLGDVLVGDTSTNLNVLSGSPKIQVGDGTGHSSIQWYSGTGSVAGLYFGDATTGTGRYPGYIEYRHNNDSMAFRVNGDTRLLIESTGNVGIGTTNPNAPLTVWTASSASSQSALRLNNPGGFANAGAGAELIFSQDRSTSEDYRMAAVTSSQQYAGSSSGADLKFWTRLSSSITNKMTLAANGTLIIKPSGVTTGLQLEGRSSDNNFFIQFNTHGGGANKASIGTDTGNNTLQYGADNHKFVNQATNATAMSFPATAIPRVHVGSGNQNAATGKRGIRVGRTIYNWFNYGKNEGHTYLHIKTDLANNNSNTQPTMSTVHIKGYTYSAETIDSILGFHNWSSSFHNKVYTNNGSRTVVSSSYAPYLSSDGYCVIVLSIGNNYPGISIDWHQAFDPYTFRDIDVLAYSKSASTSGVY